MKQLIQTGVHFAKTHQEKSCRRNCAGRMCGVMLGILVVLTQTGMAAPLDHVEKLLSNPASVRQGLSMLSRDMRSRNQARAVPAVVMLAHYLRTHGETEKAIHVIESYGGFEADKLEETVLPAYLERACCLAANARIREAIKALDYAKEKTQGHQHARVLAAYGDVYAILAEWSTAINQYESALSAGDAFFARRNISESVEVVLSPEVPGTEVWKAHRPAIVARLNDAVRQYDIERYGEGFVDYRDARTAHLNRKYCDAIAQYHTITDRYADTIYAEAAQFYRAQCEAASGEVRQAMLSLQSFIKVSPLGLYRGEARYEMGRLLLELGNVDQAEPAFNQTLEWIVKVRIQARDLQLYAIPQKAAVISAPPAAAQTMKKYILKPANITPAMVINRQTASWYLTQLESDSLYYLGFIAFYRCDYEQALSFFTRAFELNTLLQEKHTKTLGSLHRRLQIACHAERLLARPEELKTFRRDEKLRFMLADFHALLEKWEPAERVYREFLNNPRSSRLQKACALRALGEAAQYQNRWEDAKKIFWQVVEEYKQTVSAQRAMLTLGSESVATVEQRAERLKRAYEMDRDSDDGQKALFMLGFMYYAEKRPKESLEALTQFVKRFPKSRFIPHAKEFIEEQQR